MDADEFIVLRDANAGFRGVWNDTPVPGNLRPGARPSLEVPPAPAVELLKLSAPEAVDILRQPGVVGVARNMPVRLIEPQPSDADAASGTASNTAWGITAVGADTSPFDGTDVTVAVLDTGIDAAHPAFAGMALEQQDFTGGGSHDGNGHGTHCAGTIFGRDVDGTRIGVARGVNRALIGKVLDDQGSGSSDMLFRGIQWASSNGAQVLSMSLGFDFPGLAERLIQQGYPPLLATSIALEGYRMNLRVFDTLMDLMRATAAFGTGTIVVAAAGNESRRDEDPNFEVSVSVPAVAEGTVSVGALAQGPSGLTVAPFSNTNPILAAPGVNVLSARSGGGLVALNGTSMACPHVAGVTALWIQAIRSSGIPMTPAAIEAKLLAKCRTDVFAAGIPVAQRGLGLVQVPATPIA